MLCYSSLHPLVLDCADSTGATGCVRDEMRNHLYPIGVLILAIWLVFLVDATIPAKLTDWGLVPRNLGGLIGIPLMPLLHGSLGHLLGNTLSLVVLLILLSGSRSNNWQIVIGIVLINGVLLWLFGRTAIHVGASGLIFGLIAFLIVSGLMEKRPIPLAISLLVGGLYGGTLLAGVIPHWGSDVSWDGHLCGAISGAAIAYGMTAYSRSHRVSIAGQS